MPPLYVAVSSNAQVVRILSWFYERRRGPRGQQMTSNVVATRKRGLPNILEHVIVEIRTNKVGMEMIKCRSSVGQSADQRQSLEEPPAWWTEGGSCLCLSTSVAGSLVERVWRQD